METVSQAVTSALQGMRGTQSQARGRNDLLPEPEWGEGRQPSTFLQVENYQYCDKQFHNKMLNKKVGRGRCKLAHLSVAQQAGLCHPEQQPPAKAVTLIYNFTKFKFYFCHHTSHVSSAPQSLLWGLLFEHSRGQNSTSPAGRMRQSCLHGEELGKERIKGESSILGLSIREQ